MSDAALEVAKVFYKMMKEEDKIKKKEKKKRREEKKRKEEQDKSGAPKYDSEAVEALLDELRRKLTMEQSSSSSPKSQKRPSSMEQEYHRVQFDYSRANPPNFSSVPLGKVPILDGLNYDEWAEKMKFHLIGVFPSL